MAGTFSLPVTESAPYDLIVEGDGELFRVQVKYCGAKRNELSLKRVYSNSKGFVVKKYHNDFDWLYVYRSDGQEFLYFDSFNGRTMLTVNNPNFYLEKVMEDLVLIADENRYV